MACFHCCHEIKGNILKLPVKYINDEYYLYGQFCSWECMKAYVLYSTDCLKFNKCSLMKMMRLSMGLHDEIVCAPPKDALKIFGGDLTIEEFRKNNVEYSALPYPMKTISPSIEKNTSISCVTQNKAEKSYNSTPKLSVPKKHNNPIEKSMGLIKQ